MEIFFSFFFFSLPFPRLPPLYATPGVGMCTHHNPPLFFFFFLFFSFFSFFLSFRYGRKPRDVFFPFSLFPFFFSSPSYFSPPRAYDKKTRVSPFSLFPFPFSPFQPPLFPPASNSYDVGRGKKGRRGGTIGSPPSPLLFPPFFFSPFPLDFSFSPPSPSLK